MKKKYSEIEIGELFKIKDSSDSVYMKINHEDDHNYYYVCFLGEHVGNMYSPLDDDFVVHIY